MSNVETKTAKKTVSKKSVSKVETAKKETTKTTAAQKPEVKTPVKKELQQKSYQTFAMTPTSGKLLWALTECVIRINGLYNTKVRVPKGNVVNFYSSSTILRHHIKNGNFEEDQKGMVGLTVKGINNFKARLNGANPSQRLDEKTVQDVMDMLTGPAIKNKTKECKILVNG
jgi:hypothetical protein